MKILYVTIKDKRQQGDYLEVIALRALRAVLGDNCIDYPKKKILYNDWSETEKEALHGKGFTLYTPPLEEISSRDYEDADVVVYGFINKPHYVNDIYPEIDRLNKPIIYIDGHDDSEVVRTPCFKHELHQPQKGVFSDEFGNPLLKSKEDRPIKKKTSGSKTRRLHTLGLALRLWGSPAASYIYMIPKRTIMTIWKDRGSVFRAAKDRGTH